MKITSYAAKSAKGELERFDYEAAKLGHNDVEIQISHCGVCHSDVHLVDDDWGMSSFPLVPGHEIIGLVTLKGPEVTHLAIGSRVGVGWQRSSCLSCEFCLSGREMFCLNDQATCVGNFGGFADSIRIDSRFTFPIPAGLASENAAPLLCGGITVYSPLRHYGVAPRMKVGVVGIGGLGHLALQFAHAMGCEVTAFSNSFNKEIEARDFGASHFVSSTDEAALGKLGRSLDFILVTAMA
ncbi:MAG: NAD(P)-dependent alcohol dehydrogenase, partial [Bdellovibrionota bacterium]